MPLLDIPITRFIDPHQPGFVECTLRDASGRAWLLVDKVPVFTDAFLDAESSYPQPGVVACEILREWTDETGRRRCLIDTDRPWGVSTAAGETQFEVFADQLRPGP